ncbi:MarR family transcriptional regulator [Thermosphaera chiliense]|uniref:MarR family transcriptional regulator n=1 Tax=Thermosphaera chiliense TaxID=3402707 RepID=A0A7M1UQP9_9CREN|nr:MarR family transcriptional regulator [Thermosphaera aggregans]QOR94309.1 MarR family transcriptional regulator [Thermosphaera aggregans]
MTSQLDYKLNDDDVKILKYLSRNTNKTVYQSELWKELKLDSRAVSRSLQKLESMGFVRRKEAVVNGRKTFLIEPENQKIQETLTALRTQGPGAEFEGVLDIVCVSCPFIYRCYQGGYYDPTNCSMLSEYIKKQVETASKLVKPSS